MSLSLVVVCALVTRCSGLFLMVPGGELPSLICLVLPNASRTLCFLVPNLSFFLVGIAFASVPPAYAFFFSFLFVMYTIFANYILLNLKKEIIIKAVVIIIIIIIVESKLQINIACWPRTKRTYYFVIKKNQVWDFNSTFGSIRRHT